MVNRTALTDVAAEATAAGRQLGAWLRRLRSSTSPDGQAGAQLPALQIEPGPQTMPQPPQLLGSLDV